MKKRLQYLAISELAEGMVLGAPLVLSERGITSFSLPAGHELTESNIRQIALRRGEFACIAVDDPRTDAERETECAAARARLELIFSKADLNQPALSGLFNAVLAYRSQ